MEGGGMTTDVNPVLTEIETIFKNLIWNPMLVAGENWLEVQFPLFNLPVVKQLEEGVLGAITDAIYTTLIKLVDITAIKLLDPVHQTAYESASEQLVIIATESGVNSDAYKTAEAQALAALSKFTKLSGS
jgi:hypothetical protein